MSAAQAGFSLVETLVAILVFSLALVGQAAVQAVSLANGKSANLKTVGVVLARDMADRMRSNQAAVAAGLYLTATPADQGCSASHFSDRHAPPAACTPEQVAGDDLKDWADAVAALLPGGNGTVCIDSTPDDGASVASAACDGVGTDYAIKLWWIDKQAPAAGRTGIGAGAAASTFRFAMGFRP